MEALLFEVVSEQIVMGRYGQALQTAERLLALVHSDKIKVAYVLGCKKAVALRHLGRTRHAKEAFGEAFAMAMELDQQAIASYILNDAASMDKPAVAILKIQQAIKLRKHAKSSPDPRRVDNADIAYFEAHMARMMARRGQRAHAAELITTAKTILKEYAHHTHQFYKPAYMVVLFWELEMSAGPKRLQVAAEIATEAARQGRLKATWQAALSRHRKAQVLSPEQ